MWLNRLQLTESICRDRETMCRLLCLICMWKLFHFSCFIILKIDIQNDAMFRSLSFYRECREKYFGRNESGIFCTSDDECKEYGGVCLTTKSICLINLTHVNDLFHDCLEAHITSNPRMKYGVDSYVATTNRTLRQIRISDCVSDGLLFLTLLDSIILP